MDIITTLSQFFPMSVVKWLVLLPYITRGVKALKDGGGLKGFWKAIWFGNNPTPNKP